MSDPLSAPVSSLSGVGPKRALLLANFGVSAAGDLLWVFPRRYEDRRNLSKIKDLVPGRSAVVIADVADISRKRLRGGLELVTAEMTDDTGSINATWFNRKGLEYVLKPGTRAALYGVPSIRVRTLEISNPSFEIVKEGDEPGKFAGIIPVYPSTAGLPARWFRGLMKNAVDELLPLIPETLPPWVMAKRGLPPLREALGSMHAPRCGEEWKNARRRLAYEEFFLLQAGLAYKRRKFKGHNAKLTISDAKICESFIEKLPFPLTAAQRNAINDILADLSSGRPMSRLLQGDVGSGKTVVALTLAAAVAGAGAQTAVMAPTEALAEQLYAQAVKYMAPLGVETVAVKGGQTAAERRSVLPLIGDGTAAVIVGTQALLEEKIPWKNLGAVIIDEQHRFGVMQRAAIMSREPGAHLLMMSATPIPRTLAVCLFGDLDISLMREKPRDRRKTETRAIDGSKMKILLQFLADEAKNGARAYWICPRVEEDVESETASAEKRFAFVERHLGRLGVGLLHGRMSGAEKDETLSRFRDGEIKILVATTVVEVGVDVPEASVIVIESPERFGLSQLHQLRGRVGRGARRGVCVLLVSDTDGVIPERLAELLKTDDGFAIAEADLLLRGAGEVSGKSQHGVTEFKIADLSRDAALLAEAREDAAEWAEADPEFSQCPAFREKLFTSLSEALGIA